MKRVTSKAGKPVSAGGPSASPVVPPANAKGRQLQLGPLTEAGKVRELAERMRQLQSGPPAALFGGTAAAGALREPPPGPGIAAQRKRQLAMQLLQTGKFAAAIIAFYQAVRLDPQDAIAHHGLGRAFLLSGRFAEAADSLRLAITLKDDIAAAHCDLAAALDRLGQHREAVAACRRAVGLAPQSAEGHRQLGELLERAGEKEEAAACFRCAASGAAETTAGRLDLVRAFLLEDKISEAEGLLQRAIIHDPDNDELYKSLAHLLATQGRFDEAIDACDHALNLNPLQVPAHLTAVRVRKCTEADRPRLARMLSTLRHPSVQDAHRVYLHFAIGKLLDDLGEYRDAMRHFDKANNIRGKNVKFGRMALSAHIDRLFARFTSDFFASNLAFGLADETPLLIVGMPRSGTTLVEQIVSRHPDIAAGEELFFWPNRASSRGVAEATSLNPESGRRLAAEYIALLRRIGPSALRVTDKQTFNFQQLGLIHLLLPRARIIHCRRHPVDTCLSMYFTHFQTEMPFVANKADLAFAYRQYARMMKHWRTVLPADRFLEVDYEGLIADPQAITRRLIAFCGLGWHDACLEPEGNRRRVNTASVWQARQPVFSSSLERWRRYEPWIGELRELL